MDSKKKELAMKTKSLLKALTCLWVSEIATDVLDRAIDQGGDPVLIAGAQQALADGEALRRSEEFEAAVNKYEVALAGVRDAIL